MRVVVREQTGLLKPGAKRHRGLSDVRNALVQKNSATLEIQLKKDTLEFDERNRGGKVSVGVHNVVELGWDVKTDLCVWRVFLCKDGHHLYASIGRREVLCGKDW